MACHIRKDDEVEVIAGDHKGRKGKVLKVDLDRGRVLIQGINMVFRHVRPSRRNPQGGRLQKAAPIHISNVLPVDGKSGRGRRVRFEVQRDESGKVVAKYRVSVAGTRLSELTRAKAKE
jgi:large subunit ribosomal protein L24